MYQISQAASARLRSSHLAIPRVTVTDSDGAVTPALMSGSVSLNGADLIRTTATLTFEPSIWSRAKDWPLEAARVDIRYGIGSLDTEAVVEEVPFGKLFVESVSRSLPSNAVEIRCSDVMRLVQYSGFGSDYGLGGATAYGALWAIFNSSNAQIPPSALSIYNNNPTLPSNYYADASEERLKYVRELSDAMIADVWINRASEWQLAPKAIAATPVWVIDASQTGTLLEATDERTGESTRNVITVFSEPNDGSAPSIVSRSDNDVNSPTYFQGPFGTRRLRRSSGFLKDAAGMSALADAMLKQRLGLERHVKLTTTPVPQLDPLDTVSVQWPGEFPESHLVLALEVDLAGGTSSLDVVSERVR